MPKNTFNVTSAMDQSVHKCFESVITSYLWMSFLSRVFLFTT